MLGALFASPFIRAASMGPRERLPARHLVFMGSALVLASGLVGLGMADVAYHSRLRDSVYGGFNKIAQLLADNLYDELSSALNEVDMMGDTLFALAAEFDSLDSIPDHVLMKTKADTAIHWASDSLNMVFWTDDVGSQRAKWTRREQNTPRVGVAHRAYYSEIRGGRGWPQYADGARRDELAKLHYYLESILTVTTGERLAVVSRPFTWPDSTPGVAGAVTQLSSLDEPVLPPGTEFAVVDRDARTLFHSRAERNLEENFAAEISESELLRSVLSAHTDKAFDAAYLGRSSRLFVVPVPFTPLSVIVVMDKAQLATIRFDVLFVTGALFLGYALLMFVWFAAVEAVAGTRMQWAWPDLDRPKKHARVIVILLLYVALLTAQMFTEDVSPPHPSNFVLPFQGLGLLLVALSGGSRSRARVRAERLGWGLTMGASLLLVAAHGGLVVGAELSIRLLLTQIAVAGGAAFFLWRAFHGNAPDPLATHEPTQPEAAQPMVEQHVPLTDERRDEPISPDEDNDRRRVSTAYAASVVLALCVVGIVPAQLFYDLVFTEHLELSVRYHQVQVSEALRDRSVRLGSVTAPEDTFDLAFSPLYATEHDLRSGFPCETDNSVTSWAQALNRRTLHRVPWLSDVAVDLRQLSGDQPDRCWERSSGRLVLSDDRNTISSTIPSGLGTPTGSWWGMLLGALALFYWGARWLAHRVFLLGFGDPEPLTLVDVIPAEGDFISMVIVCMRSTSRAPILQRRDRGDLQYVDLMEVQVRTDGTPVLPPAESDLICFDRFDHRLREDAWNARLLTYLEDLVYVKRKKAILLTSREPDTLFEEPHGDEMAVPDGPRRWARVLGQFAKVSVADLVPADAFMKDLEASLERKCLEVPLGPERDKRRNRLVELHHHILRECGYSRRLQDVGRQILETPGYEDLTPQQLLDHVREGADPYYRAVWAIMGPDERLVVAQLAAGAMVNPACGRSLRRLLTRGLMKRDPALHLMNQSFPNFVRETVPDALVLDWEQEGTSGTWETIRAPLIVGWIAVALFLFWTQRDVMGNTIAFLSTAGVGLAATFRILMMFNLSPGKASRKED